MTADAERVQCPACGAWAGDPCESPTGRTAKTHAARKRYAEAARIDATRGLPAARAFLPTYPAMEGAR
jgi:hypothetical protein